MADDLLVVGVRHENHVAALFDGHVLVIAFDVTGCVGVVTP